MARSFPDTRPDLRPSARGNPMAAYATVLSTDGGATFSALRPGFEQQRYSTDSTLRRRRAGSIVGDNTATFAADVRSVRYRDRLYAAFPRRAVGGWQAPNCGGVVVRSRCIVERACHDRRLGTGFRVAVLTSHSRERLGRSWDHVARHPRLGG